MKAGRDACGAEMIFREADVVTVLVPLSADTEGLVMAERLALMKPTGYLINASGEPVADEGALIRASREARIAGAKLDVLRSGRRVYVG